MKGSDYLYAILGVGIVGAIAYGVYKVQEVFSGSPLPEVVKQTVKTAQDVNTALFEPFGWEKLVVQAAQPLLIKSGQIKFTMPTLTMF